MSRRTRDLGLLVALLLAAALVRIWHLRQGLPDFVEEAIPLRRALDMGGWQAGRLDLDPHFFNYPSLVIYLQLLLIRLQIVVAGLLGAIQGPADFWLRFQIDPTGPVVIARSLGVAADLLSVLAAWRLASRLRPGTGFVAATAVAFAGVMIQISRLVQVDPVQAALTIWAVERLVAYLQQGGRGRLAAAVVLIGLAAGAKYQGALLVLPLGWVLVRRDGRRGLARWPLLAAASLGVFLLTTPYALLDPAAFWRDLTFERGHMAAGHFGSRGVIGLGFDTDVLGRSLGPVLLLLAMAAVVVALVRAKNRDRAADLTVALAIVPLAAVVAAAHMQAARYLVPLVPLLAVAGEVALHDLLAMRSRWRAGLPIAMAACLVPVLWHGLAVARTGGRYTQIQARQWLEQHATSTDVIIAEPYTAALRNTFDDARVMDHPAWVQASAALRQAYREGPRYLLVPLPLSVSGSVDVDLTDLDGRRQTMTLFAHVDDINAAYYEPQLLAGVSWMLVSQAVRGRHEQDPARYPRQVAFYALLDRAAEVAARFTPGGTTDGPEVVVYRLGDAFASALASRGPGLDPLWWTQIVPMDFRRRFEQAAVPPAHRSGGELLDQAGNLAPWIVSLRGVFAQFIQPLLVRLASFQLAAEHAPVARQLATALLLEEPDFAGGVQLYVEACVATGDLAAATKALAAAARRTDPASVQGGRWRLRLAAILHAQQRDPEAARVLQELLHAPAAPDSLIGRAHDLMRRLAPD